MKNNRGFTLIELIVVIAVMSIIAGVSSSVISSVSNQELKNFVKIELQPQEEKIVTMQLDKRSFAWYSTELQDWYAATGMYESWWEHLQEISVLRKQ